MLKANSNAWSDSIILDFVFERMEEALYLFGGEINNADDKFYPDEKQKKMYQRTMAKLDDFWGWNSYDIKLHSFSMDLIKNEEIMIKTVEILYDVDSEAALSTYYDAIAILDAHPVLYTSPIFTAYASASLPFGGDSPGIMMGDGYTQYLSFLGVETTEGFYAAGTTFILSHEYAHHLENIHGAIPEEEPTPEESRFVELLADVLAAYFLYHPHGLSMRSSRIEAVVSLTSHIGDCDVSNPNHHGTPFQREKAVHFGKFLERV